MVTFWKRMRTMMSLSNERLILGSDIVSHQAPVYYSFLLRLYRVCEAEGWGWRVFLEDPVQGTRYRFQDLESLFSFLRAVTEGALGEDDVPP